MNMAQGGSTNRSGAFSHGLEGIFDLEQMAIWREDCDRAIVGHDFFFLYMPDYLGANLLSWASGTASRGGSLFLRCPPGATRVYVLGLACPRTVLLVALYRHLKVEKYPKNLFPKFISELFPKKPKFTE